MVCSVTNSTVLATTAAISGLTVKPSKDSCAGCCASTALTIAAWTSGSFRWLTDGSICGLFSYPLITSQAVFATCCSCAPVKTGCTSWPAMAVLPVTKAGRNPSLVASCDCDTTVAVFFSNSEPSITTACMRMTESGRLASSIIS